MSHAFLAIGRLGWMAWTSGKKSGLVLRYTAGLVFTTGAGFGGGEDPVSMLSCWSLCVALKKSLGRFAHQPHFLPRALADSPWERIRTDPDYDG